MALISKPDSRSVKHSNVGKTVSSSTSMADKRKKRTLAKQQQISENLANLANDLLAKTQEGASAIEELKSAMEQITVASEENASAAEESLSAVDEIAKNTESIYKDVKSVVKTTDETLQVLLEANESTLTTSNRMAEAKGVFDNIVKKAIDLKKAGDNIGELVSVIAKVADQTNLLALNAAIGAARAKEHGKGFAVVADEIRSLAAISSQSADDTAQVVNEIQKSIGLTQSSVEKSGSFVSDAATITHDTANKADLTSNIAKELATLMKGVGEDAEEIMEAVNRMQKGAEGISSAAEEQASAVNQATSSIDMQASALAQSEQAASSLVDLAEDLKNSTDVSKDAEEIASAAEELSGAIEEIQKSMGEVTSALTQIEKAAEISTGDATENATIARESLERVSVANEKLDSGINFVKEIVVNIEEIVKLITQIAQQVKVGIDEGKKVTDELAQVEKYSKTISKILRKIENVIVQTTMLAVSGSIEAARAGEFGKGFAVVSSDIRNLAQDAQGNLEKILDIMAGLDGEISMIIVDWNNATSTQEQEVKDLAILQKNVDKALNSVRNFELILSNLQNANNQNLEALNQALQGSEQIQQAADLAMSNASQSKEAASLIVSTVEEMGNFVEELAVLADELQQG